MQHQQYVFAKNAKEAMDTDSSWRTYSRDDTMQYFLRVAASVVICLWSFPVSSAEITYVCREDRCRIFLYGVIEDGDADQFRRTLVEIIDGEKVATSLSLMSRGGLVHEAIEIGRMVRATLMETVAPEKDVIIPFSAAGMSVSQIRDKCRRECINYFWTGGGRTSGGQLRGFIVNSIEAAAYLNRTRSISYTYDREAICASACALIALAGIERSGVVGLHHIFSRDQEMSFAEYQRLLSSGNDRLQSYLQEMRIAGSVFEKISTTRSDELAWHDFGSVPTTDFDPVFYEYLNSRCDLLTREEMNLSYDLRIVHEDGFELTTESGRTIGPRLSRAELALLEDLEERRDEHNSCLVLEVRTARIAAQSTFSP